MAIVFVDCVALVFSNAVAVVLGFVPEHFRSHHQWDLILLPTWSGTQLALYMYICIQYECLIVVWVFAVTVKKLCVLTL